MANPWIEPYQLLSCGPGSNGNEGVLYISKAPGLEPLYQIV